jgi:hypothetical protein
MSNKMPNSGGVQSELSLNIDKGLAEFEKFIAGEDNQFFDSLLNISNVSPEIQNNFQITDFIQKMKVLITTVITKKNELREAELNGFSEEMSKHKKTITLNYMQAYNNLLLLNTKLSGDSKTLTDFEKSWANTFLTTYYMIIMNAAGVEFITDNLKTYLQFGDETKLRGNIMICKSKLQVIVNSIRDLKNLPSTLPQDVADKIVDLENQVMDFTKLFSNSQNEVLLDIAGRVLDNHFAFQNTIKSVYTNTVDRCFHK